MTTMSTTKTTAAERLADEILAAKADLAQREAALKELQTALLQLAPVGTSFVRDGGKVVVTTRTDLVADVEVLRGVASRNLFKSLTRTVFDVASYRALVQLGRSTAAVDEVITEKVSDPYLVTTVAKK